MVGSGAWRRVTRVMLDDAHLPSERETPVVDNSTNGAGHERSGMRRVKAPVVASRQKWRVHALVATSRGGNLDVAGQRDRSARVVLLVGGQPPALAVGSCSHVAVERGTQLC